MRKFFIVLFILLLTTACNQEVKIKPSGKSVKIGVLVPKTGKNKRFSKQSLAGLKAALKMQPYLKNGDKIELIILDTKSHIVTIREAFYKLNAKKVKSIISFMGSDSTMAAASFFKANTIPLVVTLATNDNIVKLAPNISQVCFDNNMQSLVAAHYIKDEKFLTHAGIIYDRSNHYSHALAKEFKKYYKAIGGHINFYISITKKSEIKKLKREKMDATQILYNTTDAKITLKILELIEKKSWSVDIVSADGLLSSARAIYKGDISKFDGLYVTEHYASNVLKSKQRKVLEKYLKEDGFEESSYAFLAYDGYMLLQDALNSCTNYTHACINKNLQNSGVINGAIGNFSIINAKVRREVYVDKIKNAKLYKEIVTY